MLESETSRCLVLACGNPLRGDDGVGPRLAAWVEDRFAQQPGLRVISCQQWAPELAEEVAYADSVIFVDASMESAPGEIRLAEISSSVPQAGIATHHLAASQLLGFCQAVYACLPHSAQMLTVGAGSVELGEALSTEVTAALPQARASLARAIEQLLESRH